jgi:hypothetical protein
MKKMMILTKKRKRRRPIWYLRHMILQKDLLLSKR